MKNCAASFFLLLIGVAPFAQRPAIPEEYAWKNAKEYSTDSVLVIRCLEVLCEMPLNEDLEWRSSANAFVMSWLSGSPTLKLEINSKSLPFLEPNQDLLYLFVHGMALYSIKHPVEKNNTKLMAEGLRVVARLAKEDELLRRESYLKPILRAARRNKLEDYVQLQLAAQKN